jgi:hypothetical protein
VFIGLDRIERLVHDVPFVAGYRRVSETSEAEDGRGSEETNLQGFQSLINVKHDID